MTPDASFIPPNTVPPDPPEAKVIALVFSIFMSGILILAIGFMCVEFLAEMIGHPLQLGTQQSRQNVPLPLEQNIYEESQDFSALITPKHLTQMRGPEIAVIYTRHSSANSAIPPDLLIDGEPHPWEVQYGNTTWFARLQLEPGEHCVQVEEAEAEFVVDNPDAPSELPEFFVWNHPHPDINNIDRCHDCHEVLPTPVSPFAAGRSTAIGAWKGSASCFVCHDAKEHEIRHAILHRATNQCLRCHTIH